MRYTCWIKMLVGVGSCYVGKKNGPKLSTAMLKIDLVSIAMLPTSSTATALSTPSPALLLFFCSGSSACPVVLAPLFCLSLFIFLQLSRLQACVDLNPVSAVSTYGVLCLHICLLVSVSLILCVLPPSSSPLLPSQLLAEWLLLVCLVLTKVSSC